MLVQLLYDKLYSYSTWNRNLKAIYSNWNSFFLVKYQYTDINLSKKIAYNKTRATQYFWRTKQQQEIDYVEENSGVITGYEFKWSPKAKVKKYRNFMDAYNAEIEVINRENFKDLIG